jgi:HK97 family phage portal protein
MGLWRRIKNAAVAFGSSGSVSLEDDKLLDWLGIDGKKPKAIREITYYTCLKTLSETMGKLPLKMYKEDAGGGRVRVPPDESADVILNRPNPYMTPSTFWSTMEMNCQHYGNAYAWIQREFVPDGRYGGSFRIKALWPMRSNCVTVYMDDAGIFGDKGKIYYQYSDGDFSDGTQYVFRAEDVIHIKTWMTWDGVMGKSVRDILHTSLDSAGYSQQYLEELYKSGLTASSVLQYTGDLDEKLRSKLQQKYNELLTGAKNAGKVVALPVGMTLTPLSYKLADAQYLELRRYNALQIAAAFGIKPNQINDYEKSSYASSEAQQLAFLVDTMLFRIAMYEQEINVKLLTEQQRSDGYILKFNEKVLLRADAKTQMTTIATSVNNGIRTVNEGRHLLDLPSVDGGDIPIVNGNYIPLERVGDQYSKSEGKEEAEK